LKGNLQNTDVLIITSPEYQKLIEKEFTKYTFQFTVNYYLLDIHTLFDAGCARLQIFNYENINLYDKILYLDVDILINSAINTIFDLEINDRAKLYVLEEGNIGHELWGGHLFDFSIYDINQTAFTSGILFFYNNYSIRQLFIDILIHIKEWIQDGKDVPVTLDQPFIIYNSFMQNKYDNQLMKKYFENNPSEVEKEKIIYHFPGGPGFYSSKYEKMTNFWKKMNSIAFITLTNSGYIDYTFN